MNRRIVVTGASGLVGRPLVQLLTEAGWEVIRAVRRPVNDGEGELSWDPEAGSIDSEKLEGVDAVVHLAGENVGGGRWTESRKQRILHSRTKGTLLISEAIASLERKPAVLCCASAIGYYGSRGDEVLTESSSNGNDFLADVCRQWEQACQPARDAGIRVVNTRIGVILSRDGGALAKMLTPFKLGLGGVVGSGRQFMSWVSLVDVVAGIKFALDTATVAGPANLAAPNPVTNKEFTKTLGGVLSRPTIFPVPAFAARVAFGELADGLLLSSTRVNPKVLSDAGFEFSYAQLEPALRRALE